MISPRSRNVALAVTILISIIGALAYLPLATMHVSPARKQLVVYCAHDSIYADSILKKFEQETRIPVQVRYDSEATKSLGLVEMLLNEKNSRRCDVFWNNELLGTLRLQKAGILESYKGPGWQRIPEGFKDPAGEWTGFAARMRVYIVNTQRMTADESKLAERLAGDDLNRVAIAKPLYGTTFTQYALLHKLWGAEKLKAWHEECRTRKICEVAGNAAVKNIVAAGDCDFGFTDSDDCYSAMDEGRPIAALPVRIDNRGICIPNTVSIIRGTKRLDQAQALADYLLSAGTELALAQSASRQIPLGPVDETALPKEVKQLKEWSTNAISITDLGPDADACLAWLKGVYTE